MNILYLGIVVLDLLDDVLRGLLDDELVPVHHDDLGFGDHLDALDLIVIDKEPFIVPLGQYDHSVLLSPPPGRPKTAGGYESYFLSGSVSPQAYRFMFTSSSSMESVTVTIRVLA